jgi:hypothetical protein
MTPSDEGRLDDLEIQLIEQEHRLTHIFYRWFFSKELYPASQRHQSAARKAIVWGFLFSPASVAIGTGLIALVSACVTAWLLYRQTEIMYQSVDPITQVTLRVGNIGVVRGSGLEMAVAFSNAGNHPVYVEDMPCIVLRKLRLAKEDGSLDEESGRSDYYDSTLVPVGNRVVSPRSIAVVRYQMPQSSDIVPEAADGFRATKMWKKLSLPAEGKGRFRESPEDVDGDYLLYVISRIPVSTFDNNEYGTFAVACLKIDGGGSGADETGVVCQSQYARGDIWPAGWVKASENPEVARSVLVLNKAMRDQCQRTTPTNGSEVHLIDLDLLGKVNSPDEDD